MFTANQTLNRVKSKNRNTKLSTFFFNCIKTLTNTYELTGLKRVFLGIWDVFHFSA
jgi:hypothetical protein